MSGTPPLTEQTFFADPAIDRLFAVTMTLAAEVHVLRSRVRELESRLGLASEALTPDEDADAFAARLLAPLAGVQEATGPR